MSKLPKTRAEAMREFSMHYFTGKKCKNGHLSIRKTTNGTCVECQAEYNAAEKVARDRFNAGLKARNLPCGES